MINRYAYLANKFPSRRRRRCAKNHLRDGNVLFRDPYPNSLVRILWVSERMFQAFTFVFLQKNIFFFLKVL